MKIITSDKIAPSNGPYSQGYIHNGIFYSAGRRPTAPIPKVTSTTESSTLPDKSA